jgi:flavin-binding protein dodecin
LKTHQAEGTVGSIVKVIEVIAQSDKGFDDAVRNAVAEAAKTIKGIRSVWVDNLTAEVDGNRVTHFRVNAKISFMLEGHP